MWGATGTYDGDSFEVVWDPPEHRVIKGRIAPALRVMQGETFSPTPTGPPTVLALDNEESLVAAIRQLAPDATWTGDPPDVVPVPPELPEGAAPYVL